MNIQTWIFKAGPASLPLPWKPPEQGRPPAPMNIQLPLAYLSKLADILRTPPFIAAPNENGAGIGIAVEVAPHPLPHPSPPPLASLPLPPSRRERGMQGDVQATAGIRRLYPADG